jgi:hypothetical protein
MSESEPTNPDADPKTNQDPKGQRGTSKEPTPSQED